MKIESVDLYRLNLPLKKIYGPPSIGRPVLPLVLARVVVDGQAGWGEVSCEAQPMSDTEWADGVFFAVENLLVDTVLNVQFDLPVDMTSRWQHLKGISLSKSVIETAVLDAVARTKGKSVPELLNQAVPGGYESPMPGVSSGKEPFKPLFVYYPLDQVESFELFCREIEAAVANGYRYFELKCYPGWEIGMLNAVRDLLAGCQFHLDFGGDLQEENSEILFRAEDFFPLFIQQPFSEHDMILSAMVKESYNTPFCLSRGITTGEEAEIAFDMNAGQIFGASVGKLGGLLDAKQYIKKVQELGAGLHIWNRLSTGLGARITQALAAINAQSLGPLQLRNTDRYPIPCFDSENWFEEPLFDSTPTILVSEPVSDSSSAEGAAEGVSEDTSANILSRAVPVWTEPGFGLEPNMDVLEKYSVEKKSWN